MPRCSGCARPGPVADSATRNSLTGPPSGPGSGRGPQASSGQGLSPQSSIFHGVFVCLWFWVIISSVCECFLQIKSLGIK